MDSKLVYNGILGRSSLKQLKAIHNLCLKFVTPKRVVVVKKDQPIVREHYLSIPMKATPRALLINSTIVVERNMPENSFVEKQVSKTMKDG